MADVLIKKRQLEPLEIVDADVSSSANISTSKLAEGDLFIKSDGTIEFTAAQSMGLNKLSDLAAPTNPNDAVRLVDLQNAASGIDIHDPVITTTDSNITLSGLQTIASATVVAGDRVLVQKQTDPKTNGIYIASSTSWSRASDADETGELKNGTKVLVQSGDHAGSTYICTGTNPITIGTSDIPWVQDSQSILYSAGAGMVLTGTTFSVGTASSSRIKINATNIDLATTGVTSGDYTKVTVDVYGRVISGANPTTLSGYGITNAYTQTQIGNFFSGTTSMTGYNKTNWDNASNAQVTGITFNTGSGVLTLTTKDTTNLTQNLDGRYSLLGHTHALSDLTDVTIATPATNNLLQYNGTAWVNWAPTYISGNQTINFSATGDVTGSDSGTTSLAPALTIGAKKVTYAKIQDVATQSLLGRYASTDGNVQEVTLGTGLTLSNTTGILSATGTGGTVTSITAGEGMDFTTITGAGAVTMGAPSAVTLTSTNSLTSTSHTHAFVPGGTTSQYIDGTGALQTIPVVNNATLTLSTSGIATGSQSFTANQATAATFTVNVPGTNLTLTGTTGALTVVSSTGSDAVIPLATTTASGLMSPTDKTKLNGIAAGAQTGTVTSVGITLPSILTATGSPITTSGTFAISLATQAPNAVFAGPATGSTNAAPTFRALTATDIPSLSTSKITSGVFNTARLGSGTASSSTYLTGTGWVTIPSIPQGTVTSIGITGTDFTITGSPVTTSGDIELTIGSNKVTYAKIQQVGASSLLGNYATTTGNVKEITLGTGLLLSSTTGVLSATGTGGTVTSVAMTVPTGLSITGSPITTSGTLALSFTTGYSIPTTANQTIWSNKQDALSGTGFVKASGTTLSYDNSTYVPTSTQVIAGTGLTGGGTLAANRTFAIDPTYTGFTNYYTQTQSDAKYLQAEADTLDLVVTRGSVTGLNVAIDDVAIGRSKTGIDGVKIEVPTAVSQAKGFSVDRLNDAGTGNEGGYFGALFGGNGSTGSLTYAYWSISNNNTNPNKSGYSEIGLRLYPDGSLHYTNPPVNPAAATKFLTIGSDSATIATRTASQVAADIGALTSFTETDPVWTAAKTGLTTISGNWIFSNTLNTTFGIKTAGAGVTAVYLGGSSGIGGISGSASGSLSGDIVLATYAQQDLSNDSWTAGNAAVAPTLLHIGRGGVVEIYSAPVNQATGTFANFWTTKKTVATQEWGVDNFISNGFTTDGSLVIQSSSDALDANTLPGANVFYANNSYTTNAPTTGPLISLRASSGYGGQMQIRAGASDGNIDNLFYRSTYSDGTGTWFQVASRDWVGDQNFLTSFTESDPVWGAAKAGTTSITGAWTFTNPISIISGGSAGLNLGGITAFGGIAGTVIGHGGNAYISSYAQQSGATDTWNAGAASIPSTLLEIDARTGVLKLYSAGAGQASGGFNTFWGTGSLIATQDWVTTQDYLGASSWVANEVLTGTVNGTNKIFTLANTPVVGSQTIYLNGAALLPGAGNGYTISGSTVTLTVAPVSSGTGVTVPDVLMASYFKS